MRRTRKQGRPCSGGREGKTGAMSNMEAPPPLSATEASVAPAFKDRSTLLAVFGVAEILLGGRCALLFVFAMRGHLLDDSLPAPERWSMFFNLPMAVFLVWVGIGSFMARRWSRALVITASAIWVEIGVMSLLLVYVSMTAMPEHMPLGESGMPAGPETFAVVLMSLFMGCIYILLPGELVLFYSSPHVKATCEYRDPVIRWTDKCPLPVLAMSLMCGFNGVWMLLCSPAIPLVPLFDTFLVGWPATAVMAAAALVVLVLSWGTYRLHPAAWWGCMVVVVLWGVVWITTFRGLDWDEIYRIMGYSRSQIELVPNTGMAEMMDSPALMVLEIGWLAFHVGYLLYVRRYFKAAA